MKLNGKILIAASVALVYFSEFHLGDKVRILAQTQVGPHPYEGLWAFIPHLLFYSTVTAALAGVCWFGLTRAGAITGEWIKPTRAAVIWGAGGGLVSAVVSIAFLLFAGMGEPNWGGVDAWETAGNVFSNFWEELIYRGFLLASLTVLIGFWPAAVLTSITFGLTHEQYPLAFQGLIAVTSFGWCWLVRRSRSMWAAWGAHMILDVIVDAIWG